MNKEKLLENLGRYVLLRSELDSDESRRINMDRWCNKILGYSHAILDAFPGLVDEVKEEAADE